MFRRARPAPPATSGHSNTVGNHRPSRLRRAYRRLSLARRLTGLMALGASVAALLAGTGILGLAASNEGLRAMYEDRMVPVRDLSRIHQRMLTNRLLLQSALSASHLEVGSSSSPALVLDANVATAAARDIKLNLDAISLLWTAFASRPLTAAEADLTARFTSTRERYLREALLPAIAGLGANDHQAVRRAAQSAARFFEDLAPQLEALGSLQFELAHAAYEAGTQRYHITRWLSLSTLLASMLLMGWLGMVLIRSIVRPLERVIETFRQISLGHYDSPILIEGSDEISKVMHALQTMQAKLGADEVAIHRLAFFDPLTNLPNRRLLRDRLQTALNTSARDHVHGAVMLIDLDNFKIINDSMGHDVGDALLVQMAQRIQGCLRQADTVARLGGDEFVVMLVNLSTNPDQAAVQAEGIGEKILHAIRQPCLLAQQRHEHTASIGICLFQESATSIEDVLKRADLAMYQAKATGRDTQRFFDPQIQTALEARLRLEVELRQALPKEQLELFYQVQIDHQHQVLGAEVLLRWRHPTRGLVGPIDFISIAEESGLIVAMGEWVLRTACEQLKRWQATPATERLLLSVNVSARQFRQPDFVRMVQQIINQTGINTRLLKLELTESLVLHNVEDTVAKMKALNRLGIQFSMDDFGTGYSSLSQLNKLPIAQLKIDRSFVNQITHKHHDAVIVQTIIGMANNLGLSVIAEGVETEAQRALLEQLGCLAYQGFLMGRPMPLCDFEELVHAAAMA